MTKIEEQLPIRLKDAIDLSEVFAKRMSASLRELNEAIEGKVFTCGEKQVQIRAEELRVWGPNPHRFEEYFAPQYMRYILRRVRVVP